MNKRPGHVTVTTETGYCSVCGRTRNLRREEHQLGTLVRTIVTCETCHRTLSSTMGVASAETPAADEPVAAEPDAVPPAKAVPAPRTAAKSAATAKAKPKTPSAKATRARPTKSK
ncbi:MAG: hypothetical protein ABI334_01015 [Candidatus Dormiibacterota bacterium]